MEQGLAMPESKRGEILGRIKSLTCAGFKFNQIADQVQGLWPGARVKDVSDALKAADPDTWNLRAQFRLAAKEARGKK